MKVHFIAIGGSAMHNLAIALHHKGVLVTGSDDEIFEPARSRLKAFGLLPENEGWFPEKINESMDAVILGMHARKDNPELKKANDLGIKVYSYPEYLYEQSKNKTRIVVGGSHGKTTITAMILHVMKKCGMDTDYMVGAQLEGFDVMVRLSEDAPFMVIEGDEYLTSPLDPRPKFHLYQPDIAIISGIAWDHINVFPTFENYVDQFRIFISKITPGGILIYNSGDPVLTGLCQNCREDLKIIPYGLPEFEIEKNQTWLKFNGERYPLEIFGAHNLLNLNGARFVCEQTGIDSKRFYEEIRSFRGASRRLEKVASSQNGVVYKDFAHAPSKVAATLKAVREQYPDHKVVACLELHTYSSLNMDFLPQYAKTLDMADIAIVYYNPHALQIKRLPYLEPKEISRAFALPGLEIFNDSKLLFDRLLAGNSSKTVYLMMSSGNYDGIDLKSIINHS